MQVCVHMASYDSEWAEICWGLLSEQGTAEGAVASSPGLQQEFHLTGKAMNIDS